MFSVKTKQNKTIHLFAADVPAVNPLVGRTIWSLPYLEHFNTFLNLFISTFPSDNLPTFVPSPARATSWWLTGPPARCCSVAAGHLDEAPAIVCKVCGQWEREGTATSNVSANRKDPHGDIAAARNPSVSLCTEFCFQSSWTDSATPPGNQQLQDCLSCADLLVCKLSPDKRLEERPAELAERHRLWGNEVASSSHLLLALSLSLCPCYPFSSSCQLKAAAAQPKW